MKKIFKKFKTGMLMAFMTIGIPAHGMAQSHGSHIQLSLGSSYPKTLEATLAYEQERDYHHAWEYFGTYSIQYADDPEVGHVTPKSFWHNYNTWEVGMAYKPCVTRGRNHHGSLRIGASAGSDFEKVIGAAHFGYEHTYNLYDGWSVFFSVKESIAIHGKDRFKTGVSLGVKVPL